MKEKDYDSAMASYDDLDTLFDALPSGLQKKYKKRMDYLYFDIYSDTRN